MIYGSLQQLQCFQTLTDKNSQTSHFKGKTIHFSETAAGLSIGQELVPGPNENSPTHEVSARPPIQQGIVNNHKIQADQICKVSMGGSLLQVPDQAKYCIYQAKAPANIDRSNP